MKEVDKIQHVVSFSGGKDSTAMLIRMIELNMRIDKIIFADTRLEFDYLYKYINKIENYINHKIKILKPPKNYFKKWFYGKWSRGKREGQRRGFPFVSHPCWIRRESKTKLLRNYHKEDIVNYVGIAIDEKERTKRKLYQEHNFRFPLIEWNWTEFDALNYLKEKGLYNKLYDLFDRLGCWLCPYQNYSSLRSLYNYYPEKWTRLKQLEKASPQGFKPDITLNELENKFK